MESPNQKYNKNERYLWIAHIKVNTKYIYVLNWPTHDRRHHFFFQLLQSHIVFYSFFFIYFFLSFCISYFSSSSFFKWKTKYKQRTRFFLSSSFFFSLFFFLISAIVVYILLAASFWMTLDWNDVFSVVCSAYNMWLYILHERTSIWLLKWNSFVTFLKTKKKKL